MDVNASRAGVIQLSDDDDDDGAAAAGAGPSPSSRATTDASPSGRTRVPPRPPRDARDDEDDDARRLVGPVGEAWLTPSAAAAAPAPGYAWAARDEKSESESETRTRTRTIAARDYRALDARAWARHPYARHPKPDLWRAQGRTPRQTTVDLTCESDGDDVEIVRVARGEDFDSDEDETDSDADVYEGEYVLGDEEGASRLISHAGPRATPFARRRRLLRRSLSSNETSTSSNF